MGLNAYKLSSPFFCSTANQYLWPWTIHKEIGHGGSVDQGFCIDVGPFWISQVTVCHEIESEVGGHGGSVDWEHCWVMYWCGAVLNYLGDWVMRLKVRSEVTVGQWIESYVGWGHSELYWCGAILNYLGDCRSWDQRWGWTVGLLCRWQSVWAIVKGNKNINHISKRSSKTSFPIVPLLAAREKRSS